MTIQTVNSLPVTSPVQVSTAKSFLGDVVDEAKDQLGVNVKRVLSPIDTSKRVVGLVDQSPRQLFHTFLDPYTNAVKSGHSGRAVGHLLANVVSIGAVVLGGRFLLGKAGLISNGGASVGYGTPLTRIFDLVKAPFKLVGGLVGKLFSHGGRAGVGF